MATNITQVRRVLSTPLAGSTIEVSVRGVRVGELTITEPTLEIRHAARIRDLDFSLREAAGSTYVHKISVQSPGRSVDVWVDLDRVSIFTASPVIRAVNVQSPVGGGQPAVALLGASPANSIRSCWVAFPTRGRIAVDLVAAITGILTLAYLFANSPDSIVWEYVFAVSWFLVAVGGFDLVRNICLRRRLALVQTVRIVDLPGER